MLFEEEKKYLLIGPARSGKTSVAINLAYRSALDGLTVLLIDCTYKADVSKYLHLPKRDSTLKLLLTEDPIDDLIEPAEDFGFDVILGSNYLEYVRFEPTDDCIKSRISNRLNSLDSSYDFIVIDSSAAEVSNITTTLIGCGMAIAIVLHDPNPKLAKKYYNFVETYAGSDESIYCVIPTDSHPDPEAKYFEFVDIKLRPVGKNYFY